MEVTLKTKIKYWSVPISIILIVFFAVLISFKILLRGVPEKENIIKIFNDNKNLFYEVVDELTTNGEYVSIRNGNLGPTIEVYIDEENELTKVVKVKESDYHKYKKTLEFINRFEEIDITYDKNNFMFLFSDFAQYIVKMRDENKYRKNYIVLYIENIENDWYYVETKR